MNNSIIKLLLGDPEESGTIVLVSVIIFVLVFILLFIYLASCIIIVKQGTRKIVERFGSYNRTLREGIHIIFRPFDRIAPVPWNILSISERDEFEKNMSRKRIPFFNDHNDNNLVHLNKGTNKLIRDIKKDIETLKKEDNLEEYLSGKLDIEMVVQKITGKTLNQLATYILESMDSVMALEEVYRELGIDSYRADPGVISQLVARNRERDALAASVKYYPRHQDPHSRRRGVYAMAENHVQDFVDMRERHIDTSNERVRTLFALKLDTNLDFPKGSSYIDQARGNYKVLNGGANRFSGINLITKDNASIGANIVIFFSVTDPFLYYYGVDEPEESLVLLAITTLRNIVSGLTLEEALQARQDINKKIREELDVATNNWGIKANRVEVKEFELGYSMQKAMDDVLIAEREKRANILRAEGYRKMKEDQVMAEHIRLKGYETLEEVSRGPANKVFIPNDLSDFITGAHVVADAFKDAKKEKVEEKPEEK